jgi:FkbM family methyltransferase
MDKDPRIRMFEIAYGREPDAAEKAKLAACRNDGMTPKTLRSVIAFFDRQFYPTAISVRFERGDLHRAEYAGTALWLDTSDHAVSSDILLRGTYESHMTAFVQEHVKSGMTVVDIGANVGVFTMMTGKLVGATGKVLAFEPNSENSRMILLSAIENGLDEIVTLYPVALSDRLGFAYFTPMVGSNGGMLPDRLETLSDPNVIVVPTMRLDDIWAGPVHYIKADVEGAEYPALKGAEKIIREHRPIITIELSMEMTKRVSGIEAVDFIRWLNSLGYEGTILGRTGAREPIGDPSKLLERWGDSLRIEDIAFLPV